MSHWMARVARRAGFPNADSLELAAGMEIGEVWRTTTKTCGVDASVLAQAVAKTFGIEVADLSSAEAHAQKLVPASIARKYLVFPVRDRDRHIAMATADPTNMEAEKEVGFASGRAPTLEVASPQEIALAIDAAYSPDRAAESLLSGMEAAVDHAVEVVEDEAPEEISVTEAGTGPVVRLTNMIFFEAVERSASDIHIQPLPSGGVVRYRVDGVLHNAMQMPLPVLTRVISRIKIMSKLNIADRIRPQDGRARILIGDQSYDLRISTVPTRGSEKAVIRILDPLQTGTLDDTGIQQREVERIRHVLKNRDGIFVVTGPTGSGKTTTLYAALRELATEDVNIMTVEDPVEYELAGLTQIQVDTKKGVTFASALRAILRQDPDIIFVGEIRDGETARIAAQASLTGHLVLATLHTNDAVGSIRRFTDLGLDPGTLSETIRGALAQRLVRRICPHCSVKVGAETPEEHKLARVYGVDPAARGEGCERCGESGYLGRLPVTEFMATTPELLRMIVDQANPADIFDQTRRDGMNTLLDSGLEFVREGLTTLQEIERVVGRENAVAKPPEPRPVDLAAKIAEEAAQEAGELDVAALAEAAATKKERAALPPEAEDETEEQATRILVVDDDPTSRTLARAVLESQGMEVVEASDGSEALALLARGEHFSLMVLDLDMPMLGGKDVLKAVRASMKTAGLPVIVLTGSPEEGGEIELMEAGADDYIHKPMDPPRFLTRVRATLRRAGG